jgi:hypothetical protein
MVNDSRKLIQAASPNIVFPLRPAHADLGVQMNIKGVIAADTSALPKLGAS